MTMWNSFSVNFFHLFYQPKLAFNHNSAYKFLNKIVVWQLLLRIICLLRLSCPMHSSPYRSQTCCCWRSHLTGAFLTRPSPTRCQQRRCQTWWQRSGRLQRGRFFCTSYKSRAREKEMRECCLCRDMIETFKIWPTNFGRKHVHT